MAMNAGDLGNIGGPKPHQGGPIQRRELPVNRESLLPESTLEQVDQVVVGRQGPLAGGGDVVSTGTTAELERPEKKTSAAPTFLPVEVDGAFVVGGVPSATSVSEIDYSQLTAVNGLNSTTLVDTNGRVLASVNPLTPVAPRPAREQSGAITGLNGLGSTEFHTLSGRVLRLSE